MPSPVTLLWGQMQWDPPAELHWLCGVGSSIQGGGETLLASPRKAGGAGTQAPAGLRSTTRLRHWSLSSSARQGPCTRAAVPTVPKQLLSI